MPTKRKIFSVGPGFLIKSFIEKIKAKQTSKLNRTWSFSSGVSISFALKYSNCMACMFCKYCVRLQQQPAKTSRRKKRQSIRHCLDESCQSPAKISGKIKRGSFTLIHRHHSVLSSLQNQVKSGINNKNVTAKSKGLVNKPFSC